MLSCCARGDTQTHSRDSMLRVNVMSFQMLLTFDRFLFYFYNKTTQVYIICICE